MLQDQRDHRRGGGLAVGAGDRDRAAAGHRGGQRLGAVQHPQPAPARLDQLQVVRAGSRSSRRRCRHRPGWTPRGVMWMVPPSARRPASDGHSRSSLPETGMPRVSSSRARPPMPTPPMPIRWTLPRSSAVSVAGRRQLRRVTAPHRRPHRRHRLVARTSSSASSPSRRPYRRRGRAHRGQPLPVAGQRDDVLLDPLRGELGVVDQEPAAGLDHRQRVAPLLLLLYGSGT